MDLLGQDIRKVFFKYLIPSVGGMMGTSLYVLGDTILVGRALGAEGLAALNISIPIINVFYGLGLLFGIGGATALSISRGRGEHAEADIFFTLALKLAIAVGLLLTLARILFLENISRGLGATGNTLTMSMDYLGILMSFSLAFILNHTMTVFVRNDGAPNLSMYSMLAGNIANIVLDYIFLFKLNLGMRGVGLATGLSPIISLGIISSHFVLKKNNMTFRKVGFRVLKIKRIILNGMSSFITELSAGIVIFAFNISILNLVGEIGVSAYSIIANLSLMVIAIFTGVGQAIQPIVSINHGAGKHNRVEESLHLGVLTVILFGIIFYAIGYLFPEQLTSFFSKGNEKLIDITVRGIRLYFLGFFFMGYNVVKILYLQSREQSKVSLQYSILRGFVFILLGLALLPKYLGLDGVWLTLVFAEVLGLAYDRIFLKEA